MTDEEFEEFNIRTNHLKYPKGNMRRLNDISDALTKAGEHQVKDETSTGIAIQCQKLPVLEAKELIESYANTRALQIAEKAVEAEKRARKLGASDFDCSFDRILSRIKTDELLEEQVESQSARIRELEEALSDMIRVADPIKNKWGTSLPRLLDLVSKAKDVLNRKTGEV